MLFIISQAGFYFKDIFMSNKAVIFDMDGVLIDSWEVHYQSWAVTGAKFGFTIDRKKFGNHFGQTCDSFVRTLCSDHGVTLTPDEIAKWMVVKDNYYRQEFRDTFKENKQLSQLLLDLNKNNFRMGIGSSAPRENIQDLVEIMPHGKLLEQFICAGDVSVGKPNPEVFLLAAKKLGVAAENCAVIEDSIHGLQAAKSAAMAAIGFTGTFTKEELIPYADLVVDNPSEINSQIIDNLIIS